MGFFSKSHDHETFGLTLHMKSGNTIVLDQVTDYKYTYNTDGSGLSGLHITYLESARNKLLVTSLVLSQVEALTVQR